MPHELEKLSAFFKALGDPTRLRILQMLIASDKLCGGVVAHRLGISPSAVSQHLGQLKKAQLVLSKRIGFRVHYNVNREMLNKHHAFFKQFLNNSGVFKPCNTCPENKGK